MDNWSYTQHKHQETELIRRAQDERIASSANIVSEAGSTNPITAWVGEKLIDIGTRLTSEPQRIQKTDYVLAEITR